MKEGVWWDQDVTCFDFEHSRVVGVHLLVNFEKLSAY